MNVVIRLGWYAHTAPAARPTVPRIRTEEPPPPGNASATRGEAPGAPGGRQPVAAAVGDVGAQLHGVAPAGGEGARRLDAHDRAVPALRERGAHGSAARGDQPHAARGYAADALAEGQLDQLVTRGAPRARPRIARAQRRLREVVQRERDRFVVAQPTPVAEILVVVVDRDVGVD